MPPRSAAMFQASSKETGCKRKPFILEPAEGTETPLKLTLVWREIVRQPIFCFQRRAALGGAAGRVQRVHACACVCMRVHACACPLVCRHTSYTTACLTNLAGVSQSGLAVGNQAPNKPSCKTLPVVMLMGLGSGGA